MKKGFYCVPFYINSVIYYWNGKVLEVLVDNSDCWTDSIFRTPEEAELHFEKQMEYLGV